MLRFEPVALADDLEQDYGAVIVTSANALRAVEGQLGDRCSSCRCLPSANIPRPKRAGSALPR